MEEKKKIKRISYIFYLYNAHGGREVGGRIFKQNQNMWFSVRSCLSNSNIPYMWQFNRGKFLPTQFFVQERHSLQSYWTH
jgi:hypothetical protein